MTTNLSLKPSTVYSILDSLEIRFDDALASSRDPITVSVRFEAELTGIQLVVEASDCEAGRFGTDSRRELMQVIRDLQIRMIERAYQKAIQSSSRVQRARLVPQSSLAPAGAVS